MYRLEPGNVIGFFEGAQIVHAMLCVGKGLAAGNKNNCVGIGSMVWWEILDLANGLAWQAAAPDTSTAPALLEPTRDLLVRRCPISYRAYK